MSYNINSLSSDCYEKTNCLINKLGIKDDNLLSVVEADITYGKLLNLEKNPVNGNFDTPHYKAIHKYLFEDLYEWAGDFRKINISTKGTRFVESDRLDELCEKCFERLKACNYFRGYCYEDFVDNIVDFYCTLNMLHPFREGNGRTQRVFISQLIRYNGYDINFSKIDTDLLMIATIQSAHGVTDLLTDIFRENIVRKM